MEQCKLVSINQHQTTSFKLVLPVPERDQSIALRRSSERDEGFSCLRGNSGEIIERDELGGWTEWEYVG